MNSGALNVAASTKRLLIMQITSGGLVAIGFFWLQGLFSALSTLYGAGISIISLVLLARGVRRAEQTALVSPKQSMGILYLGAVQRFVIVIVLFLIGLMLLKLDALATAVGFVAGQLATIANVRAAK